MPDSFTPNLHLALQVTGENNGTWGNDLNNNVFTVLDSVLGGTITIPLSNADVTLTTTQAQNNFFLLTGTLTANVNLIFPPIGRTVFIVNATTGSFSVTLTTTTPNISARMPSGSSAFYVLSSGNAFAGPNMFLSGAGTTGNLPRFANASGTVLVDSGVAPPVIASQAQAETGTSNTVYNTPLRTAQQTTARLASQVQAQAGTDNNALMTSLRTSQAIQAQATAFPSLSADPNFLSFPLGTVLTATGSLNRNQACNIYLDATDATAYRITSNGASMLDGTWLSRGRIGSSILAVRIS